jgi:hypothetical protein
MTLSAANRKMLYIPPGFAHGFIVTSTAPISSTRPPITGVPSTSARCCGTIARRHRMAAGIEPDPAAKDIAGVPLASADCY